MTFDAVILASSPHASTVILGLTLAERGRRVALKVGARRVHVIDGPDSAADLARWDAERGDAALLVIRAGDQLVHRPLVDPLLRGTAARRIAVGPDGYAGALWVESSAARDTIATFIVSLDRASLDRASLAADVELVRSWTDAEQISHGDIARHAATTPAECKAAAKMLLRILVKHGEDSPVSEYIYRPLSRPITRMLLHTSVTANQVSYVVALIGLLGCWFTAQPSQSSLILGAALVFVSGVIDGCDGEISRLRLTSSSFGAWLDTVVDETTTTLYFVAVGYHTYAHYPEPWIGASVVVGTIGYVATIYAIYYFCIVVLKAGGSQYYIGTLEMIETESGVALRAKPRAASTVPPWMREVGTILMYGIRRDFINLGALAVTLFNGYPLIYFGMLLGGMITALIVVPEHVRLRRQLRELARRGGEPRLLSS